MKPSIESIQAIEDCELLVISRKDLLGLYEGDWKWQQVGRVVLEEHYMHQEDRLISMLRQQASERYRLFAEANPEIIQKVPLHHIASYLGISPETLSRIRKNI
jgi:CRP-like cAMP-binding protein